PNTLRSKIAGEIAHARFKRSFRNSHDVVFRNNFFCAEVAESHNAPAFGHQWSGSARDGNERVNADVVRDAKALARSVDEFSLEIFRMRESNAVNESLQGVVLRF